MYKLGNPPAEDIDLKKWVYEELKKLETPPDTVVLPTMYRPPVRPRDGMVVLADGTQWDPGDGGGYYGYFNGTWNLLSGAAAAAVDDGVPWCVYGSTTLGTGSVDNPTASANGLIGESSLPYTVPTGKLLIVDVQTIQGPANVSAATPRTLSSFIYFGTHSGTTPPNAVENDDCGPSLSADINGLSNQFVDMNLHVPAGIRLNLRLQNAMSTSETFTWSIFGRLFDA